MEWENLSFDDEEYTGEAVLVPSRNERADYTMYEVVWGGAERMWTARLIELRFGEELDGSGWYEKGFYNPSAAKRAAEEHYGKHFPQPRKG